jgi:hypothetical protein
MTNADKMLATRPTVLTSESVTKWLAKIQTALDICTADVAALSTLRDARMVSGSSAEIEAAELLLATAERDRKRLQLNADAATRQIPILQRSEAAAAERLISYMSEANAATLSFRESVNEHWDRHAAALAGLLTAERNVDALRRRFYQARQNAPELARAAVPSKLVSVAIFAPGSVASTVDACVTVLPAAVNTTAPDSPRPRFWPPIPVAPARAPAEPSPPIGPSTGRSWTVIKEHRNPPGPYAREDDDLPAASSSPHAV